VFDHPRSKFPTTPVQQRLALLGDKGANIDQAEDAARSAGRATFRNTEAFGRHAARTAAVGVHDEDNFPARIDGGHQHILSDEVRVSGHRLNIGIRRAGAGEALRDCVVPGML